MFEKRKVRYKKRAIHPITMFILLTILLLVISSVLSFFKIQASYSKINSTNQL